MDAPSPSNSLNFNVGVLGHIDSGKTSLCKAISTTASTASFDKNPQSQERGITLDLGFSSFCVPIPGHLSSVLTSKRISYIQYTLVDCPGHASLIRTIISGAQIMDLMLLVLDVTKGIQTQTAECLVIGEITCSQMIVVLNKVDLLAPEKRESSIAQIKIRLQKVLASTKFAGAPVVAVAAHLGGQTNKESSSFGLESLVQLLAEKTNIPKRDATGPLLFSVDHCFSIKGQGTVMTGTMLSGTAKVNDSVEIADLKETRKIKSMQMFRQPVTQAVQGDRVGICVANFDSKLLERGFVASPGTLMTTYAVILPITKIKYFKQSIKTRSKFHITIGHETVMAKLLLFSNNGPVGAHLDWKADYEYVEELQDGMDGRTMYALVELESPVTSQNGQPVIASRLDTDINQNTCRLAFFGNILECLTDKNYSSLLHNLKIFKNKEKLGVVERIQDSNSVIVKNLVKKETDISRFEGLRVLLSTGEYGIIEGSFGKSGKLKVRIPEGISESTLAAAAGIKKSEKEIDKSNLPSTDVSLPIVRLLFKRYVFDSKKQMIQTSAVN